MRSNDAGEGGQLTVRTAVPTRNQRHLCRLLAENLGKVERLAQVGDLQLSADDVVSLEEKSGSLLPDETQTHPRRQVHPYLNRTQGKEPVIYPSKALEVARGSTLGVPVF